VHPRWIAGVDGVARLDDGPLVYANALPAQGMTAEENPHQSRGGRRIVGGHRSCACRGGAQPAVSAWLSFEHRAHMREGQHVLVLGATSVTGALAVQLAKAAFGAVRVVAAGRNAARLEWLQTVGNDAVIPLEAKDLAMRVAAQHRVQPFDVVLDYLWGSPAEQVLAALGNVDPNASFHVTRFVQIGEMGRPEYHPSGRNFTQRGN